uniref:Uncharacterized protein n=1 Tax=Glossina palpalis gambiensis TaxID=67801 RepID=A0A1B0BBA6_9MUSC
MVKNGNQQNMKRPTIIAKVLAAFVSIRNRLTCALMLRLPIFLFVIVDACLTGCSVSDVGFSPTRNLKEITDHKGINFGSDFYSIYYCYIETLNLKAIFYRFGNQPIRPLQKPPRRPTSVRSSDFLFTRLFCGSEAVRCSGSSKLLLISQLKSGPSPSPSASPSPSPSSEQPEIVLWNVAGAIRARAAIIWKFSEARKPLRVQTQRHTIRLKAIRNSCENNA